VFQGEVVDALAQQANSGIARAAGCTVDEQAAGIGVDLDQDITLLAVGRG